MSKYVFINVQDMSDISTKVFEDENDLREYLEDFCDEDDEFSPDDLIPYGEVNLDFQTLIVLEIN